MIAVLCSSPSCRARAEVTASELSRSGLVAVLGACGWSFERQALDTEPNFYCPSCKESDTAA